MSLTCHTICKTKENILIKIHLQTIQFLNESFCTARLIALSLSSNGGTLAPYFSTNLSTEAPAMDFRNFPIASGNRLKLY